MWNKDKSLFLSRILTVVAAFTAVFVAFFIPTIADWYRYEMAFEAESIFSRDTMFIPMCVTLYLCDGLASVRRTSVKASRTEAPPSGELFRTRREVIQVSSERMDALVSHAFRLSRAGAQSLFPAGKVFLDGAECLSPDAVPEECLRIRITATGENSRQIETEPCGGFRMITLE